MIRVFINRLCRFPQRDFLPGMFLDKLARFPNLRRFGVLLGARVMRFAYWQYLGHLAIKLIATGMGPLLVSWQFLA